MTSWGQEIFRHVFIEQTIWFSLDPKKQKKGKETMKIAFGYKQRSGKDTACDFLIEKFGGEKLSFATLLKGAQYEVQDIFGFQPKKDRDLLQFLGQWARSKNPTVFVDDMINRTNEATGNVFVNDVRYPNEIEVLKKAGFMIMKINRQDRNTTGNTQHESEILLDSVPDSEWDCVLSNNDTIERFHRKLLMLASRAMIREVL